METVNGPRYVVVHGVTSDSPPPDEADTLRQVAEIVDILNRLGCRCEVLPVGLDLAPLARLAEEPPAAVVNLVEALDGAGRLVHLVPSVLEAFGLPMTGCSAAAHFAASNKGFAKRLMRDAGIATPAWIEPGEAADPAAQWIVKSVWEHASIGLDAGSVVAGGAVAAQLAERQATFGGDWFAERYIEGREFNVSLLGAPNDPAGAPEVLPVAEMTFVDFPPEQPRIVDYAAKWDDTSAAYHNTVRRFDLPERDAALIGELGDIARACWRCFGLAGYARVDFRVDEAGRPWVLEVNANPCLSSDAGFVAAGDRAGISQRQLVLRLLECAGLPVDMLRNPKAA